MSTYVFTRARAYRLNHREAIADAYQAAGLKAPRWPIGVAGILKAEPTVDQVAQAAADELLEAEATPAWLDKTLEALGRAEAAQTLRSKAYALDQSLDARRRGADLARAAKELHRPFDKIRTAFTEAALQLDPERPLDPETVLATHTSTHYDVALECLRQLGIIGAMYDKVTGSPTRAAVSTVVQAVVSFPEVDLEQRRSSKVGDGHTINPSEQRKSVRRFRDDAKQDLDRALIHVARGSYGGISLKLAADLGDLNSNAQRFTTATEVKVTHAPIAPSNYIRLDDEHRVVV